MSTGIGKAADRLQSLHNVHLLICIVVLVFGVVDLLDSGRKLSWIEAERATVDPILKEARRGIVLLRQSLYAGYGLSAKNPSADSETGRVASLIVDTYLANDYISKVTNRILFTASSARQGAAVNEVLYELPNHLERYKIIFSYRPDRVLAGTLTDSNEDFGLLGEPQSLPALTIEDLARLCHIASAFPRGIVESLGKIASGTGRLSAREVKALEIWLKSSKTELESLKHIHAASIALWESWAKYNKIPPRTPGTISLVGPELDTLRKLKASMATTQNLEEFYRRLRVEDFPLRQGTLDSRSVKVPGLDIDLRYRHLLVVFPWLVALLLAFKFATMNQIRFSVAQVAPADQRTLQEMTAEAAGTLPLFRWTGPVATLLVIVFIGLTEVASVAVIPIVDSLLNAQLKDVESRWFVFGSYVAFLLWIVYEIELLKTRRLLFATPATKDGGSAPYY